MCRTQAHTNSLNFRWVAPRSRRNASIAVTSVEVAQSDSVMTVFRPARHGPCS
jgi:hypothetical protein